MKSREELIKEYLAKPYAIGDKIEVFQCQYKHSTDFDKPENINKKAIYNNYFTITSIEGDFYNCVDSYGKNPTRIHKEYLANKVIFKIGANPFAETSWRSKIDFGNWSMESLIYKMGFQMFSDGVPRKKEYFLEYDNVVPLNWNPFVIDANGQPFHFQRELCWTLNDKQLLMESIYNGIEIGKIILKYNDFSFIEESLKKYPDKVVGHYDIIDGKQRLNAIAEFISNKFPDKQGNYYRDFSNYSKHRFGTFSGLSLGEIKEEVSFEDIIKIFLAINFTGVQMSQDHIDYVKLIKL